MKNFYFPQKIVRKEKLIMEYFEELSNTKQTLKNLNKKQKIDDANYYFLYGC